MSRRFVSSAAMIFAVGALAPAVLLASPAVGATGTSATTLLLAEEAGSPDTGIGSPWRMEVAPDGSAV